jgi:putative urate catabolism protein
MNSDYPRDLIGYGATPPEVRWPNGERIAINFVINYEEGGENCVLHGDPASEQFLSEIIGAAAFKDRHQSMETIYEFGSRAGFWRLHRLFEKEQVPVTVFGVAMAMERNPDAVDAMLKSDWEICSHGYRWINYQETPIEVEREHMEKAIEIHTRMTGSHPKGWYTGRTSPNTLKLVAENGNFLYCADSYSDDLPYYDHFNGAPLLMVPYTLDTNDMRFASPQGFNCGDQFFTYLKDAFDTLYEEGEEGSPKMMSVGIHCRLLGRPGRIASLKRFIQYAKSKQDVWFAKREEIAQHWADKYTLED